MQQGRAVLDLGPGDLEALAGLSGPVAAWLGRLAAELGSLSGQRAHEDGWAGWQVRITAEWQEAKPS